MKRLLLLLPLATVSCSTGPAPNFFNGNYYMAGDANCKSVDAFTDTRVRCYDSKHNFTGYRDAMNVAQMQMFQAQQAYQSQQVNALTQQVQQTGETFRQAGQAIQQQGQSYTPPPVMNPSQPSNTVKCIKAGIYVNCRQ
ncbi:hypothetical protein [Sphingomonas pseudosanguinis]|uniref:Lipoprotein n=1 Tax=Sphingomonas pseudosanguinis TaxID=413712 RepID=A0A7W6F4H0_9SPHN|nr:hypothetical protein [Sphingomonas pseudosanguinis]MBB3880380.1 hypothetical protein [Sphingomonas pseudosanguinis]MBN3535661.1 hypothetical protein [Sphingomonas pseudosanguinis]